MYQLLGKLIVRWSPWLVLGWLVLWAASEYLAPNWRDVAQDQEFAFLPPDAPSRISEAMLARAFPDDQLGSSVVLLLKRRSGEPGFNAEDRRFATEVLEPGIRSIAEAEGGLAGERTVSEESPFDTPKTQPISAPRSIIARIRTPASPGVGSLLVSKDGRAWLVVVELTSDFLSSRTWPTLRKIDELVQSIEVPAGLEIYSTGSAVLGRDRNLAQLDSARATERWTVILVVALLLLIYRAPLLTIVPLLTVFMAVRISIQLLAMLAAAGYLTVFEGIQIYVTIVAYGAGVDYCLFLTARYREHMEGEGSFAEAMARSIGKVGSALTASAATVMGGIGMMTFAEFGKFHQAGIAMPLAILMVLLATLTFAAPLMRACGRWAFWPYHAHKSEAAPGSEASFIRRRWENTARLLVRRPGAVWLASVALMAPFAIAAVALRNHQTFDMLGGLPADSPSVQGARVLQEHFPAGLMGPITVLLVNPHADFASAADQEQLTTLTAQLEQQRAELGLADVRTLTSPLGISETARQGLAREGLTKENMPDTLRQELLARYAADFGERRKTGTRIELILEDNPFAQPSLDRLDDLENRLQAALPEKLRSDAQLYLAGATPGLRDLRTVKNSDQVRIEILVLIVVFLILWLLLRALVVSVYLILSVLFSYYATLGVCYAVFWLLAAGDFPGLDWKVGIFLFTILIAVGEDYNIFLVARVAEEQKKYGSIRGMTEALVRTGPIISSCGLIMAGTFASLMMGSLAEMKQLGFALAFGVLLDTFVVRPLLVPAFLMYLHRWRLTPRTLAVRELQTATKE